MVVLPFFAVVSPVSPAVWNVLSPVAGAQCPSEHASLPPLSIEQRHKWKDYEWVGGWISFF